LLNHQNFTNSLDTLVATNAKHFGDYPIYAFIQER